MRQPASIRLTTFDQHHQHAAARQTQTAALRLPIAIAHHLRRLGKGSAHKACEKLLLDAATRQRADGFQPAIADQHRAWGAWGRAIGGQYRAKPDRLASPRPLQGLVDDLQIKMLHVRLPHWHR
ncbi:hypothetical protein D3C76_1515180 [compost metagenome]